MREWKSGQGWRMAWRGLHSKKSHKGNWEPACVARICTLPYSSPRLLHSKKSHKGNWEGSVSAIASSSSLYLVAFEEIPQRELRDLRRGLPHCRWKILRVAFEEIPQRELRDSYRCCSTPNLFRTLHSKKSHKGNWEPFNTFPHGEIGRIHNVAFEEIPQRELRVNQRPVGPNRQPTWQYVAFEEIPQRELRV